MGASLASAQSWSAEQQGRWQFIGWAGGEDPEKD
jgi:hypothetical protein